MPRTNEQARARSLTRLLALVLISSAGAACGDPADFRPAKGVRDLKPAKVAYRVQESVCESIGFVKRAETIADIAETVANNGGTEFRVLSDNQSETVETDFRVAKSFGVTHGTASSRVEKHHLFTAEAYRCN